MARGGAHPDGAEAERAPVVYTQHARVQSRKGKNVMCEEITDTRVTPLPKGQQRRLLSVAGQVRNGKRVIRYTGLPIAGAHGPVHGDDEGAGESDPEIVINNGDKVMVRDTDAGGAPVAVDELDIDLVEGMRTTFTSNKDSKDGVNAGLFPLTSEQQKSLAFELKGRETKNGHDTFHLTFRPKEKDYGWRGEAWIDAAAFQPVVLRTALSRSLPLGVRTLLGTNLPGLGFTVIYAPQAGEVWFPASFGSEFKLKVLFFFRRDMVVSVENRGFERTHVTSTLHGAGIENGTVTPEPQP